MIVRIGAGDLDRLVPGGGLGPELGPPVELDEGRFILIVDEAEGVDSEPFHHPQAAGDGPVRHRPHDHVGALRHQANEVPEGVVGGGRLRVATIGLHLGGVDQVRELLRVLDEEDRDVVAHEVPVAFDGVELHGEAPDVTWRIDRTSPAGDGGETGEDLRALADLCQHLGPGVAGQGFGEFEIAVRPRPAGVNDALGDALMVEVLDLFAKNEVLQQRRPARTGLQRVLIVADGHAMVRRQPRVRR